jgi:hypothetical protein
MWAHRVLIYRMSSVCVIASRPTLRQTALLMIVMRSIVETHKQVVGIAGGRGFRARQRRDRVQGKSESFQEERNPKGEQELLRAARAWQRRQIVAEEPELPAW